MTAATATKTDRHAIIACEAKTKRRVVLSVHPSYDAALAAYTPLDDARFGARAAGEAHNVDWYAVRSVADPMVADLICAQFKLGPKQALVLSAIVRAVDHKWTNRRGGGTARTHEVEVAQRAVAGNFRDTARFEQISQIAKRLEAVGLVRVVGVAYGPKSYRPTSLGRLLSDARRGENAEGDFDRAIYAAGFDSREAAEAVLRGEAAA